MNLEEIKRKVESQDYDFLRENEHLGDKVILLGLGGSHAYGTSNENSDVDLRGIALNKKEEILTNQNFEQFENNATDTVIYSFNKMLHLLSNCNPNTIEILGLRPEHYLKVSSIGQELLDNKKMFLSKKAVETFGGYAYSQLRRLDNKAARLAGQAEQEQHILNSINNARATFPEKYFPYKDGSINLYIDDAVNDGYQKEIFMDIHLEHYPLRDYKVMWSEMHNIVKDYAKIGKRNKNAIENNKLGKHMCHLIRLYLMCLDILEKHEINTYRENDIDFLMEIRNGKYLDDERQPIPEFFVLVEDLQSKMKNAAKVSTLPDKPDYQRINDFMISVNERVVRGDI